MCEDIVARVAGLALVGEPARVTGHARHPVRDEDYPGMVPSQGGCVGGILYRAVPAAAWPRLDAFEGEMYERRRVLVHVADGSEVEAWTYLFKPAYRDRLIPGDWSFERFMQEGKERFNRRYLGFEVLK